MNARRLLASLRLIGHLLAAAATSGWQTLRIILRRRLPASGFADYLFQPLSSRGTVALAYAICLTPGTTAVEVWPGEGRMRLHLLDAASAATTLDDLKRRTEPLVRLAFDGVQP
jgi:multisubunit Na+/H+ antiporter MnhE subunit